MNNFEVDLNTYLTRIGFDGSHSADLKTLKRIILLHQNSIAFENINSFAGLPVVTDPVTVQKKLLYDGRGGYCCEQNGHLRLVLIALDFPSDCGWPAFAGCNSPKSLRKEGTCC